MFLIFGPTRLLLFLSPVCQLARPGPQAAKIQIAGLLLAARLWVQRCSSRFPVLPERALVVVSLSRLLGQLKSARPEVKPHFSHMRWHQVKTVKCSHGSHGLHGLLRLQLYQCIRFSSSTMLRRSSTLGPSPCATSACIASSRSRYRSSISPSRNRFGSAASRSWLRNARYAENDVRPRPVTAVSSFACSRISRSWASAATVPNM